MTRTPSGSTTSTQTRHATRRRVGRRASLSDYERAHRTPTPRTLDLIAAALGVTALELFGLAAVVRRFRTGTSLQGPESTSLHSFPDLEREIVALLQAEVAQPHTPLRRP